MPSLYAVVLALNRARTQAAGRYSYSSSYSKPCGSERMGFTVESIFDGKAFPPLPATIEYEYRFAEYEREHERIAVVDERCAVELVRSKLRGRTPGVMLGVGVNDPGCPDWYPPQEARTTCCTPSPQKDLGSLVTVPFGPGTTVRRRNDFLRTRLSI